MSRMKLAILCLMLALAAQGCALIDGPILKGLTLADVAKRPYVKLPETIKAGDLNIAYMEAGSGPWLILVHGGVVPTSLVKSFLYQPFLPGMVQSTLHAGAIATADSWNYNFEALAKNYHVIAIDLPGFGASDKPKPTSTSKALGAWFKSKHKSSAKPELRYTRDFFVAYLQAFMEAKGIPKASFIGHDLGGAVVLGYALDHPERVDRIVLVNPYGAHTGMSFLGLPRPLTIWWQNEKAARINIVYGIFDRLFHNEKYVRYASRLSLHQNIANSRPEKGKNVLYSDQGKSAEFIEQVSSYHVKFTNSNGAANEVRDLHSALRESRRSDLMVRFGEIKAPTLIIYGEHDPFVTPEEIEFMDQKIPDSSVIIYSRSAHYPMVEESDRFNDDVSSFLALSRSASPAPPVPAAPAN